MHGDDELHLLLVGHADEDNSEAYNHALSLKRAGEVKSKMVARHPELAGRVEVDARGEWDPAVDGDSEENKAQNRRVEFVFHYPRACEAEWNESFADCMLGRLGEPEPEPKPEPAAEPEAPLLVELPREAPRTEYLGLYGFVGAGWSVSSFDLVRHHLPWGVMGGYVWGPTRNLRISVGGQVDHHAHLGFLFDSGTTQCSGACASPLHLVRVLPEGRIGGVSGPMWAHLRIFAGPVVLLRPPREEIIAGEIQSFPVSARVRPNLGIGPGFTFALSRRLMLSLDFEVSFDGRLDDAAGVYGGKVSLGRFMGDRPGE
jgi:hypothetical protein